MFVGVVLVVKKSVRYLYACLRYVLSGCPWSGISLIRMSWVALRSVWYGGSPGEMSSVVLCLVWFGRNVCPLVSWSSSGGMAEILLKFRKLKNFVTKFGSFGDSEKSDFSIWWSGSKADVLPDSITSIVVNFLGSMVTLRWWPLASVVLSFEGVGM